VEQLDNRTCNRFSAHLQEHGGKHGALKPASIWTYSKSVRQFMNWAKREGEKVAGEVKLNKLPQVLLEILSPEEIDKLEAAATNVRDALIIAVLSQTGMRRNELCGLTTRDLLTESGQDYLLVHGKGGRDRKVPVTPRLARRLRRYIVSRPADVDSKRIFLGLRRRPGGTIEPLTDSGVTQLVSSLGERVLGKKIGPHQLRHSMITMARRRHMDPMLIAKVVGHSSLQMMSRIYDHLDQSDSAAALMQMLRADD
jgi:integrase/recombinase XerC